jgi:hypothetical protein
VQLAAQRPVQCDGLALDLLEPGFAQEAAEPGGDAEVASVGRETASRLKERLRGQRREPFVGRARRQRCTVLRL